MQEHRFLKKYYAIAFTILFVSFFNTNVHAQNTGNELFKWNFSERIRLAGFDNAITLDNDTPGWFYARYKTNAGFTYKPVNQFSISFKAGNEAWLWFSPESKQNTMGEVFVDQLFVDWKEVFNSPLNLTLGRQNLVFDEGFVVMDGQPLLGSRAISFNAVKSQYLFSEQSAMTAFVAYQPKEDDILPVLHRANPPFNWTERDNTGAGLYFKKQLNQKQLSIYYLRKTVQATTSFPSREVINTGGFRVAYPFVPQLVFTLEAAVQSGNYGVKSQQGYGGYFHLDYIPEDDLKFILGGFYLSGDKQSTAKAEGWNPMWGRWPKWSESYIYTLIKEQNGRVAYWTNISALYGTVKTPLGDKVSLKTSFYLLYANQESDNAFASGQGIKRGNLLINRLDYRIDAHWTGHLVYETFSPGDFYPSDADGYHWMRFEIQYKL